MPKIDDARNILASLKPPDLLHSDICCYSLLALASISEQDKRNSTTNEWSRIHDIIEFTKSAYNAAYC
jgi:hypothetical protein